MSCPTECQKKHSEHREDIQNLFTLSINPTMRSLFIKSIIALFILYGVFWAYSTETFATKVELTKVKDEIRSDIKDGFQMQRVDFNNFIKELKKAK